jgi:hypothetical protein
MVRGCGAVRCESAPRGARHVPGMCGNLSAAAHQPGALYSAQVLATGELASPGRLAVTVGVLHGMAISVLVTWVWGVRTPISGLIPCHLRLRFLVIQEFNWKGEASGLRVTAELCFNNYWAALAGTHKAWGPRNRCVNH